MVKRDVDPRVKHIVYVCSKCGKPTKRDDLTVKRVEFSTMGEGYKNLKRRNVDWLCGACREDDPHWHLPPYRKAPGMANTKISEDP